MQGGHFIDGHMNSIMFDLRCIHSQCPSCNIFRHGNKVEYYKYMLDEYGQGVIDELRMLSKASMKITIPEYETMISHYTEKLKSPELQS